MLTKINHFFHRGKTGRLVFKKRPWCWYTATVVKTPQLQPTNYLNGIITFTLRAYYPFARTDLITIPQNTDENDIKNNSAMLSGIQLNTNVNFAPMTNQTEIYVFNPGTETASSTISIEGYVGEGVTIYNESTDQKCDIVSLSGSNGTLSLDSLSGKVLLNSGSNISYGFLYHDNGFIDLSSNYPVMRNVVIQMRNGSNSFHFVDDDVYITQEMVGKHIGFYDEQNGLFVVNNNNNSLSNFTNQSSFYISTIQSIDDNGKTFYTNKSIRLENENQNAMISLVVTIVSFNKIIITPKDTMNITNFNIQYKPTFQ